ncbi:MAG: hypothetical protein ACYCU0_10630 [Solirubrobacteraceae bacterium]
MADAQEPDEPDQAPNARVRLMHEVAEQMDAIEAEFGDGFEIGSIVTVVEVRQPGEDGERSELRVRSNAAPWVSAGMLRMAERIVLS